MATTRARTISRGRDESGARSRALPAASPRLTQREQEVLALLRHRFTDREIADHLGIGVRTVESHVSAVLAKLGTANRRAAAALAAHEGFA